MDIPVLSAFVAANKYPGVQRFELAIKTLEDGLAARHIWNVDYVTSKDTLSRTAEDAERSAYDSIRDFYYPCGGSELYKTWANNDPRHSMGLVQFLNAPGLVKKLKTVKNAPELEPYIAMLSDIAQLAELCKSVKPLIEKGRKPNPNPKEVDVTNTGICPVCMKRQKLTFSSEMVAHGYTVPQGYGGRNGMCIGHGYKAWELSPEGAIAFRDGMVNFLADLKRTLKNLEEGNYPELEEKVMVRTGFGKSEPEIRKYAKGSEDYERVRKSSIFSTESNIRYVTSDIEQVSARVKNWKAQPLKYGGAETQKRWESKMLQKDGAAMTTPAKRYGLAVDASTDRKLRVKGQDGRWWILVDWQVVYGDMKPDDYMPYENYVPEEGDHDAFATSQWGPWGDESWAGRAVTQVRLKTDRPTPRK